MFNIKENLKKSLKYLDEKDKKTGFYYEDYADKLDKSNHRYLALLILFGFQTSSLFLYHNIKPKYLYNFYRQFIYDISIEH